MIKQKELMDIGKEDVTFRAEEFSMDQLEEAIACDADNYGIPVAFARDQIKVGGLFDSSLQDALIVYHPDHPKDYQRLVLSVRNAGRLSIVSTNVSGTSRNGAKLNRRSSAGSTLLGGTSGGVIGDMQAIGAIGGLIGSIGGSRRKMQEENDYYSILRTIIDEIL